jgi:sialate O-acetylesterase
MIVQQGMPVPVWGKAGPKERVTVSLGGKEVKATADDQGAWLVRLGPFKADGEPLTMVVKGENTIAIRNVLVGEVWAVSGQSNMAWRFRLGKVKTPEHARDGKLVAEPGLEMANVRFFDGRHPITDEPQWDTDGRWLTCEPERKDWWEMSACAFFFARELHEEMKIPVGIIDLSWGGLAIDRFMSPDTLRAHPELKKAIWDRWQASRAKRIEREGKQKLEDDLQAVLKTYRDAKAKGEKSADGRGGRREWNPRIMRQQPGSIFNCRILPVIPYAIRGALWWQGEWNANDPLYHKELTTLITDWRARWGQGDFPFLFVQLQRERRFSSPVIREAFLKALLLPRTAMVVTIDLPPSLHPREKDVVGHRLKLAADAIAYGKDIVYSGPLYESMTVAGNMIRLRFKHVGGGLVARDGPLKGFTIATADRKFVAADARIDGETVVVSSGRVAKPVAARHGWANVPECNLFNKKGLPASPFRTDAWLKGTAGR